MLRCERCGGDVGTEGVLTVILSKKDGHIEALDVRECRECARKQAKEED
jgi:hypothetical protein